MHLKSHDKLSSLNEYLKYSIMKTIFKVYN